MVEVKVALMIMDGLFKLAANSLCLKVMTQHRVLIPGTTGMKLATLWTVKIITISLHNMTGPLITLVEEIHQRTSMDILKSCSSMVHLIHGMVVVLTLTSLWIPQL